MVINTKEKLQTSIEKSLSWRRKEMSTLYFHYSSLSDEIKPILSRSVFCSFYAHFEGFYKDCFRSMLEFLNYNELTYNVLIDSLRYFEIQKLISNVAPKKAAAINRITKNINSCKDVVFKNNPEVSLDMESNLNSELLDVLLEIFSLEKKGFELKYRFIDAELLHKRNKIAHGEKIPVTEYDLKLAYEQIKELEELLRDSILKYVEKDKFKK